MNSPTTHTQSRHHTVRINPWGSQTLSAGSDGYRLSAGDTPALLLALCAQCHRGDQEGVAHRMSGPTLVGLLNWIIRRDWSSRQAEGKGLRTRFRWVEGARAWGGPEPIRWLLARPLWLGGGGALCTWC